MTATPGTQIGVDGRRVPVGELPALSAEEFIEQQRLEILRLTAYLPQMVKVGADIAIPAVDTTDVVDNQTYFDAVPPVAGFVAALEANAAYAYQMQLSLLPAQDTSFPAFYLQLPVGATGVWHDLAAGVWGDFEHIEVGPTVDFPDLGQTRALPAVSNMVVFGRIVTAAADGEVELRLGQIGSGITDEELILKAGSYLRLDRLDAASQALNLGGGRADQTVVTATPGTQIGVDGRRVPVAELPALTATEVIESQRLAMLGVAPSGIVDSTDYAGDTRATGAEPLGEDDLTTFALAAGAVALGDLVEIHVMARAFFGTGSTQSNPSWGLGLVAASADGYGTPNTQEDQILIWDDLAIVNAGADKAAFFTLNFRLWVPTVGTERVLVEAEAKSTEAIAVAGENTEAEPLGPETGMGSDQAFKVQTYNVVAHPALTGDALVGDGQTFFLQAGFDAGQQANRFVQIFGTRIIRIPQV